MAAEIKVPPLGESVAEATVAKWLKRTGEAVAIDEPIAELETDKITLEVYAPAAGTLAKSSPMKAPTSPSARCSAGSPMARLQERPLTLPLTRAPPSPRRRGERGFFLPRPACGERVGVRGRTRWNAPVPPSES